MPGDAFGGAIEDSGTVSATGTQFSKNQAIGGQTISGTGGTGNGGAIDVEAQRTLNLTSAKLSNEHALSGANRPSAPAAAALAADFR